MAKSSTTTPVFSTVSAWLAAGGLASGFHLYRPTGKVTDKALQVPARKFDLSGNEYETTTWLPMSQCEEVVDDFYEDTRGERQWLVPTWLVASKRREGIEV